MTAPRCWLDGETLLVAGGGIRSIGARKRAILMALYRCEGRRIRGFDLIVAAGLVADEPRRAGSIVRAAVNGLRDAGVPVQSSLGPMG